MRELGRLFRTYCHNRHQSWPKYVGYVEWVLNNVRHESTHSTPAELFLNITEKGPLDDIVDFPPSSIISNINRIIIAREVQCTKAEKRREAHRRRINPSLYKIGDSVLVKTHRLSSVIDKNISKFFSIIRGPF